MIHALSRQLGSCGALGQRLPGGLADSAALLAPHTCSAAQQWLAPAAAFQQTVHHSTDAFRKLVHNAGPRSLEFQRQLPEELVAEARRGFATRALLTVGGYYSRESRYMRSAGRLYTAVTEQAAAPTFLKAMGVPQDFQQVHSSLCLHIWLLLVRLRPEGKDGRQLAQLLYDDFQSDVEDRARKAGVRVRLQKQLMELEKQFYGSSMAYDRAIVGGEALDKALLRNIYLLDATKEDEAQLLARYVRRELACLTMTPSEAIMAGNVRFSADGLECEAVAASSSSSPEAVAATVQQQPRGSGGNGAARQAGGTCRIKAGPLV